MARKRARKQRDLKKMEVLLHKIIHKAHATSRPWSLLALQTRHTRNLEAAATAEAAAEPAAAEVAPAAS